jgi:hypothetical protein
MKSNQEPTNQRSQVKQLRWSLALVASEFGFSPKTVAQRVHVAGVLAGEDGLFSTADVHSAICGDIEQEKLRNLQKINRDLDTGHAVTVGELVDVQDFVSRYETIYAEIRQTIMGSKLNDTDKDSLLDKLAKLHSGKRGPGPDV